MPGAPHTRRTATVKYLLDHGAKVDVVDDAGKTPVDAAKGNVEIVALLKGAGATRN